MKNNKSLAAAVIIAAAVLLPARSVWAVTAFTQLQDAVNSIEGGDTASVMAALNENIDGGRGSDSAPPAVEPGEAAPEDLQAYAEVSLKKPGKNAAPKGFGEYMAAGITAPVTKSLGYAESWYDSAFRHKDGRRKSGNKAWAATKGVLGAIAGLVYGAVIGVLLFFGYAALGFAELIQGKL